MFILKPSFYLLKYKKQRQFLQHLNHSARTATKTSLDLLEAQQVVLMKQDIMNRTHKQINNSHEKT